MNPGELLKKELGDNLKEKVLLSNYTTIGLGGVADYFFIAKSAEELVGAVKAALAANIPYFILGKGSNIIVSDFGFSGLVILNQAKNISWIEDRTQAIVDSGVLINNLVLEAASRDFSGLEFAYGIPGTIGGAVYGNAGAFDNWIGNSVKAVTLLTPEGEIKRADGKWMDFQYRSSRLKKNHQKQTILSVLIQFARGKKEEILRRLAYYQNLRKEKYPREKNCGSIFKNLTSSEESGTNAPPEMTAGYLLDQAGAKKLKVGGVRVFSGHANMIVNRNNANANDARELIDKMRDLVQKKFGKTLEEEIEYVGEW